MWIGQLQHYYPRVCQKHSKERRVKRQRHHTVYSVTKHFSTHGQNWAFRFTAMVELGGRFGSRARSKSKAALTSSGNKVFALGWLRGMYPTEKEPLALGAAGDSVLPVPSVTIPTCRLADVSGH